MLVRRDKKATTCKEIRHIHFLFCSSSSSIESGDCGCGGSSGTLCKCRNSIMEFIYTYKKSHIHILPAWLCVHPYYILRQITYRTKHAHHRYLQLEDRKNHTHTNTPHTCTDFSSSNLLILFIPIFDSSLPPPPLKNLLGILEYQRKHSVWWVSEMSEMSLQQ